MNGRVPIATGTGSGIGIGKAMPSDSRLNAPPSSRRTGLTRSLANELGGYDMRVIAILPGLAAKPLTQSHPAEFRPTMTSSQPKGRVAQASDIAATVLFLASDEGSFYTGQSLSANGGLRDVPVITGGRPHGHHAA